MPINYSPPDPVPLRPVAAPVDTFQGAPRPPINNSLTDLAQGLSAFDAGLKDFMEARQAKQAQEDILKGQAAFYQNNQQGFEDAVREGKIPAQASPTFIASYKKAQGNVAGFDLQARFSAAYDAWDGKSSEDPQAFTKFAQGFMQTNMAQYQDPQVLKGVLPHVNALMSNGLEQWVRDRHELLYKGAITTTAAETNQLIQGAGQTALQTGKPTDYDAMFKDILVKREERIKAGVKPADMDKALVDAVVGQALEQRDPNLLKFLDQKVPGQETTFAQSPYGQKQKLEAMNHLEVLGRQAISQAHQQQKDQDEKAKRAVTAGAIDMIAKGQNVPEDILTLGSKYDPEFRVHVMGWQKSMAQGEVASDPQQILQLHSDIMNGRQDAIQEALSRGIIKNPTDLDKALTLQKSIQEAGDKVPGILKSDAADRVRKAITTQTTNDATRAMITNGVLGQTPDGLHASADFDRMLVDFIVAHPNATLAERMDYTSKAGDLILSRLEPSDTLGTSKYNKPAEPQSPGAQPLIAPAPGQPTAGPQATQPAAPLPPPSPPLPAPSQPQAAAPGQQGAAAPAVNALDAAQKWAAQLSPTQRMLLDRSAQDEGKSPDAKLLEVYQQYVTKTGRGGGGSAPQLSADAGGSTPGLIAQGNIDLGKRPVVHNADGSISTVRSMSFNDGTGEVLIPTVAADGSRILSDREAIQQYRTTGQFLGKFDTPENATAYAERLHEQQAKAYLPPQRPAPTAFDVAAGDSIAVQQVHHGVGGSEGRMGAANPGMTAVVGDTPSKVLARLKTVPDEQFKGKSVFLSPGTSNNPQEAGLVGDQLDLLKQKGAGAVAVPGVGPGVKNQATVNASLRSVVESHGGVFFQPNIKWQKDGIHPAEVDKVRQQGLDALAAVAPIHAIADTADPAQVRKLAESDVLASIQRFKSSTTLARPGALFAVAKLRNDPVAANILDMAATPESAGNYNAVIGNAGSQEDLSKLSIAQVFQLQRNLVARGMPSGAVGRYQFINSTLRGLVDEQGVSLTEKFTPELQDRLGLALLAHRGYAEWKAGKLSDEAFARNLSQEWAGLPNPDTGKSSYKGQRAGLSLGHVFNTLRGYVQNTRN